jgi:hypothetical protein
VSCDAAVYSYMCLVPKGKEGRNNTTGGGGYFKWVRACAVVINAADNKGALAEYVYVRDRGLIAVSTHVSTFREQVTNSQNFLKQHIMTA